MSIFNEYDLAAEAESTIKNFTEGRSSESRSESSSEPRADLTNGLDRGSNEPNGRPSQRGGEAPRILGDNQSNRDRAQTFTIPGEYESPVIKQRRRAALSLPSGQQILDLEKRVARANRFGALPDDVTARANDARLAIGQAREAYFAAQDPGSRRLARTVEDKDRVVLAIAKATMAVGALESVLVEAPVQQAHFETVVGDLDAQRDAALAALKKAHKAYAALRSTIQSANALAIQQGQYDKEWHHGLLEEADLNKPLEHIADAIGWLEGDDDSANGRFLTAEYEGVPPHALARLKRSAETAPAGSFPRQVFERAQRLSPTDHDAQEAVNTKKLLTLKNSNSWAEVYSRARKAGIGGTGGSGVIPID